MSPAPSISIFAILGLVILVLGAIGLTVVFLRGNRAEGAPPSPASRIGCTLFALATIATLVFLGKGCAIDGPLMSEEVLTFSAPGAEIFVGNEFLGRSSVTLSRGNAGGEKFPPGTTPEEIIADLYPEASVLSEQKGSLVGLGIGDDIVSMSPHFFELIHADGAYDSLIVVTRTAQVVGRNALTPPDLEAWVVRVRAGTNRSIRQGTVSGAGGGGSWLERLFRTATPSIFTLNFSAVGTPAGRLEGGEEPSFWIDQFAVTAEAEGE